MSVRSKLWAGTAGTTLFTLVWLIEGAIRPGYDPMRHWVSELALSDRGWTQIAGFLVAGALIAVFGRALRASFTDGPGATWAPRLVTTAGIALFAAGLFRIDPGMYRPDGAATGATWHGMLHDIAGPIMFFSIAATAFVCSRRFARRYGLTTGGLMIAFWAAAGVLNGLDYSGAWSPAPAGLFQRLSLLTGFAYLAYLAHRARREADDGVQRAERVGGQQSDL